MRSGAKMEECLNGKILDYVDQGIIFLDTYGQIKRCNQKALEIIGLQQNIEHNHDEGKLEKGDLVCIVSNSFGIDDYIDRATLEKIGYYEEIPVGKPFILLGRFLMNETPTYKIFEKPQSLYSLEATIEGLKIEVSIDTVGKKLDIIVDEVCYRLNYIVSIEHMVILESESNKVKFFQSRGFTPRHESIQDILNGNEFLTKKYGLQLYDLIDKPFKKVFKHSEVTEEIDCIINGKDIRYDSAFREINGVPTLCSLMSLSLGDEPAGVLLKIEDISDFHKVLAQRDRAVRMLNVLEKEINLNFNENERLPEIIGKSKCIENLRTFSYAASQTTSNVLLLGESGTGKSHVALAIHRASDRSEYPFVHVNCSSLPQALLESELFGYERGAFTGAKNEGKIGLFQKADGGTIFLDEIGDLDYHIQAKLLKVLQDRSYYRVGGTKELIATCRVITATNRNLVIEVANNKFRRDLYYRINVLSTTIPPLKNRREDIELLSQYLIPKICDRILVKLKFLSMEALRKLEMYDYPGNIRELENIIERAINLTRDEYILYEDILIPNLETASINREFIPLKAYMRETEGNMLRKAMAHYNNDKEAVMKVLDIKKTAFYEKLKKYSI